MAGTRGRHHCRHTRWPRCEEAATAAHVEFADVTSAPPLDREGLSLDSSGRQVPTAWQRARRRVDLEDPVVGWTASIGLTLLSLFLRLWKLGTPKVFEFDETYYAKDAWSLLHFGYARGYTTTPTTRSSTATPPGSGPTAPR